jgi:uncharacterized protein (DUF1501 family)
MENAMSGFDRRSFLKASGTGLLGLLLSRYAMPSIARAAGAPSAKAKACILLWMNGGPSHIDTFDPKPGAPTGGSFKAIKTRAPGVMLAEHLPRIASAADRIAFVRNMSSREGNHARAQFLLHTGYAPNPTVAHPSLGAWASRELGDPNADLPAFVSVGGPSFGPGFLGVQNGPFIVMKAGDMPQNLTLSPGIDDARFERRRAALDAMEQRFASETGDAKVEGRRAVYAKAERLMKSPRAKVFDLSPEPEATKKAYGDADFGRGCLLARRLVETGTRFVEVVLDGWDTHKDNFGRVQKLSATLDDAMGGLLLDLEQRKLLASTLVVCMGDFGRSPKINANDGRDHHPQAWSALLAGGGIRGGTLLGATDAAGDKVIGTPTSVPDLLATIASLVGMDPQKSVVTPLGRPIALTDNGAPIRALMTT